MEGAKTDSQSKSEFTGHGVQRVAHASDMAEDTAERLITSVLNKLTVA